MIGDVVQRGNTIVVYNEYDTVSRQFGVEPGSELVSFTGDRIRVRKGNYVHTYNESGAKISSKYIG